MNTSEFIPNTLVSKNEVPIVDLALKGTDGLSKTWMKEIANELSDAISKKGVVFLTNHGIPENKLHDVYKIMGTFFALPDEVKELYKANTPTQVQGYVSSGMEILYSKDEREIKYSYNYMNLSENLPTKEIHNFREVIGDLNEEFVNLTKQLLSIFAQGLEIDPELLLNCHKGMLKKDNLTYLRMLHYPPLEDVPLTDVTRCGEHTDWGTFTLLTQDSEGGLEIFNYGEWMRVGHLPGALLLIIGDMMDEWSSSKYKSLRHRVVIPEDVTTRSKGRYSTAFFVLPNNDTLIDRSLFKRGKTSDQEDDVIEGNEKSITALQYMQRNLKKVFE